MNVEDLTCPPEIGKTYNAPCVRGNADSHGYRIFAVFLPSHEDSRYHTDGKGNYRCPDDQRSLPNAERHYHIDPRFHHNSNQQVVWMKDTSIVRLDMTCVREIPIQFLFRLFGQRFIDDHKDKSLNCMRCPHKGINLASMPVVDGVITCPAHGLSFSERSKKCISTMEEQPWELTAKEMRRRDGFHWE